MTSGKAYLAWLHTLPCLISGRRPVVAHHVRRYGEPRDHYRAVPLAPEYHAWDYPTGIHRLGRRKWQEKFGVNLEIVIRNLNEVWQRQNQSAA
jgi:hypothetical protein